MTELRNKPLGWDKAYRYTPPPPRIGNRLALSPISKAILAFLDAQALPVSPAQVCIGIDAAKRWSQTRGDMQRRLTTLSRSGRVIALAGGLYQRGERKAGD